MTVEQMLKNELYDLCDKYSVRYPDSFALCGRLKTTAGLFKVNSKYPNGRITVSKKYYEKNGYGTALTTLRHEFVHHYTWQTEGNCSHNERFKEMCVAIGGTMNAKLAGKKYAHAASADYVESTWKFQYRCQCGKILKRSKRSLSDRERSGKVCTTCKTPFIAAVKEAYDD